MMANPPARQWLRDFKLSEFDGSTTDSERVEHHCDFGVRTLVQFALAITDAGRTV